MAWDPEQYDLFQGARERPGQDLIAALPPLEPARIVDLGCGTGHLARRLADKWPDARVVGLDSSSAMLAKAVGQSSRVAWELGDIAHWHPPEPVDLAFSNAALHWLPDHQTLFPRLLLALAPGGVLACQMPRNFASPSHALMREVAATGPWAAKLDGALAEEPVHPPAFYWRLLRPICRSVQVWETEYLHELDGPDPVLEWVRSTALLPVLERLEGAERDAFIAAYRDRLREAYPPETGGHTLFPFRRLFLMARV
ncbi:methyltransferase domain-containing protein [Aerophototrophica crusticola]|uniref:Trans-aconitate 2-methyltransferase n=1 Tax=Aerophototrophica crusticola TaxID=1709002 RepID=A0A858R8M1_9PROT|nr:methyltransferase domain-containing protein [Rhodospirillaceae bacterium B3]